jgi:hypothetical protein
MTQASNLYALSLEQAAELIAKIGHKRTVIVQGDMGSAKTSGLRHLLKEKFPTHIYVEFDCTNKDIQDLSAPQFMKRVGDQISDYVEFVPNAELGAHLGKPVIINFDEFLKSMEPVKRGVRRVMLERMVNGIKLPEGSIVYGTSNLGAEGVGDSLAPHQRNAIIIVRMAKPESTRWIEWGINNAIDPSVLGWARENPQLFQSFEDVPNPDDNPYIYHPRAQRAAFVTQRSLETASDLVKLRDVLDDHTITAGLIGAIGDRGAMDLMAFVRLADDLPSLESIKRDPHNAKVPQSAAAVCMIVYRTLSIIERDWVDNWMIYLKRLPAEAAGMFANGVRTKGYSKQGMMMTHAAFTAYARESSHLFASDI